MPILTAGYGNLGFDRFLQRLREHGVTHLVDVRSVPQSGYWEDFRRPNLERKMAETEIKYIWMGDTLGGVRDSPVLCKNPDSVDLAPLFAAPHFRLGLDRLKRAASDDSKRLLLMCGCLRPHRCHRFRLVGEALAAEGVEVLHLDEHGQPVPHPTVAEQAKGPQRSLF